MCVPVCFRAGVGREAGGGGAVEGGDSVHRMRLASSVSFWLRAGVVLRKRRKNRGFPCLFTKNPATPPGPDSKLSSKKQVALSVMAKASIMMMLMFMMLMLLITMMLVSMMILMIMMMLLLAQLRLR